MKQKADKILIVGGGSAGWMTAATLIRCFPDKDVTLVESPNVRTVGVGESTIGGINNWMNLIGIKDTDFLKYTDGTYKHSIQFTDFYKKGAGSFHYPFGDPNTEGNQLGMNDWYIKKVYKPDTPVSDYADCIFPQMQLVHQNKVVPHNNPEVIPGFHRLRDTAYHFDATMFAHWLREHVAVPDGVKHILADVVKINSDENGITSIETTEGLLEGYDLYIDCTGFKSMLLGETLGVPFDSYNDFLPNTHAWATRVPYKDKRKELVSYTDCHAIGNGWVWNIPSWERIGTGYVFSDKFTTTDDALEEFKEHLQNKGHDTTDLKFNLIKMRVGLHDKIWEKNVVAIGLSAGFIEPLESNGLYSVHEFLYRLVRVLDRDDGMFSQTDRDTFNFACETQFKSFADFVLMHYVHSKRDDTEYWRWISNNSFTNRRLEVPNTMTSGVQDVCHRKLFLYGYLSTSGLHCIMTGMHQFPYDRHSIKFLSYPQDADWESHFKPFITNLENKKLQWKKLVEPLPMLYDYLSEVIYNGEK
jgi:hypothetical protein